MSAVFDENDFGPSRKIDAGEGLRGDDLGKSPGVVPYSEFGRCLNAIDSGSVLVFARRRQDVCGQDSRWRLRDESVLADTDEADWGIMIRPGVFFSCLSISRTCRIAFCFFVVDRIAPSMDTDFSRDGAVHRVAPSPVAIGLLFRDVGHERHRRGHVCIGEHLAQQ